MQAELPMSRLSGIGRRAIITVCQGYMSKPSTNVVSAFTESKYPRSVTKPRPVMVAEPRNMSEFYGNVSVFGDVVEIEWVHMGKRMVERTTRAMVVSVQYLD